jgi:phosphoribosylformylglycinamidine synthase PurS subunit
MILATAYATFYRNIFRSNLALGTNDVSERTNCHFMKAKVYVTLKPSVLDPQGKALKHSVELLGFNGVNDIRQGKYFEIALDNSVTEDSARAEATRLAHDVLSNPIIEDFRVEIEK